MVLYEESLDSSTIEQSVQAIANADTLIIAGTSLTVYPAAGFVRYFRGQYLVLINLDPTPMDASCDLVIHGSVGKVLGEIRV